MGEKSAREFIERNRYCDHGHVIWNDDTQGEFGLTLRVEDLIEYATAYDYITGKALAWYPERKKDEIKKLWIAG